MSVRVEVTTVVCETAFKQGSVIVTTQSLAAVYPTVAVLPASSVSLRVEISLIVHYLPEVAVAKGPWLAAIHESETNLDIMTKLV
jgi:hypothetical protein